MMRASYILSGTGARLFQPGQKAEKKPRSASACRGGVQEREIGHLPCGPGLHRLRQLPVQVAQFNIRFLDRMLQIFDA